MAQSQLPPKIPTMIQNWPSSPFQILPTSVAAAASHQNSWVDEFLDFSSARRNAHRRSVSDPIAFVETPFVQECTNNNNNITSNNEENGGFERLDDEQLRKMFSDDVPVTNMGGSGGQTMTMSCSGPSTPSDENSGNHEDKMTGLTPESKVRPKCEPEEVVVDSSCKPNSPPANASSDSFVDPKRIKRILANRQSAQRSRVRKLQYISELERSVTTLQTEVSTLSPRVAFLDHQRLILNVDNSVLKQRIAALAQDKIFKDAHQEALRKEIERLRQIYHEQNMKKKVGGGGNDGTTNEVSQPQKGPTPNFTKNLMDQEYNNFTKIRGGDGHRGSEDQK